MVKLRKKQKQTLQSSPSLAKEENTAMLRNLMRGSMVKKIFTSPVRCIKKILKKNTQREDVPEANNLCGAISHLAYSTEDNCEFSTSVVGHCDNEAPREGNLDRVTVVARMIPDGIVIRDFAYPTGDELHQLGYVTRQRYDAAPASKVAVEIGTLRPEDNAVHDQSCNLIVASKTKEHLSPSCGASDSMNTRTEDIPEINELAMNEIAAKQGTLLAITPVPRVALISSETLAHDADGFPFGTTWGPLTGLPRAGGATHKLKRSLSDSTLVDSIGRRSVTPPTQGQTVLEEFSHRTTATDVLHRYSQVIALDTSGFESAKEPNTKGKQELKIVSTGHSMSETTHEPTDATRELLLQRREQKHQDELVDLKDEFEASLNHLQFEHVKAIGNLLKSQQKQEKQFERQTKDESYKKAVMEKKLEELTRKYTQQSKDLEASEREYKSETLMLQLLLKAKGQQVCELYERFDSAISEIASVHQQYQQVVTTYKSDVASLELKAAQNPPKYPADGSAFQLAITRAEVLTEKLLDITKLKNSLEAEVKRQQKDLESQEEKALQMAKLKTHLEAEVLRMEQTANEYMNKANSLQGILEYHPGSNAYQFDSMIEEKNRQYRELEKRTTALLDAHEHLKITTKIETAQRGTKIWQLTETLGRETEKYDQMREQKEAFEAVNGIILETLISRLTESDVIDNLKGYHKMVVRNSKEVAERNHEQGLLLETAKDEAAHWESRFVEIERKLNDKTQEVLVLKDAKRVLEHDKGTLEIEMDIRQREHDEEIKEKCGKIVELQNRIGDAAKSMKSLVLSNASDLVRVEIEKKESQLAQMTEAFGRAQQGEAHWKNKFEEFSASCRHDISDSYYFEESLETLQEQLAKAEEEIGNLREQLSYCNPMRRFDFHDFKEELSTAQELAKSREDFAYELQSHCVDMGNRIGELENALSDHNLELDDRDRRQDLLDRQNLLLSCFPYCDPGKGDEIAGSQIIKPDTPDTPDHLDEMNAAAESGGSSAGWETDGSSNSS